MVAGIVRLPYSSHQSKMKPPAQTYVFLAARLALMVSHYDVRNFAVVVASKGGFPFPISLLGIESRLIGKVVMRSLYCLKGRIAFASDFGSSIDVEAPGVEFT
jgi:hypothetical protein